MLVNRGESIHNEYVYECGGGGGVGVGRRGEGDKERSPAACN